MFEEDKEILQQKNEYLMHQLNLAGKEIEQLRQRLQKYEDKAAKAEKESRMKTLFLANMSHEIRTPLNAIEGFARVLVETDSYEARQSYMQIIESSNKRLLSLIDEILDMSRVESGEMVIKSEPTNLNKTLESINQVFRIRCSETVTLRQDVPSVNVIMRTDENRLVQVLSNLISNALKHTPKGTISYGYQLTDNNRKIDFYVKDNGTGIDPEFIDKIFNIYASQDADEQKGYGLGLALCKIIVEKMGGTIRVKSSLGNGSTFTFTLPFNGSVGGVETNNSAIPNEALQRTLRGNTHESPKSNKTILVAEDEESNYELVRIVLQKQYRLIHAHNGIEAVMMNEDEQPNLILMDIRMPEMNGLDATRIIKEVNSKTPVIALSAFAFDENIREAKEAGCDDFLAKPFRVEDLIEIIERYLPQ